MENLPHGIKATVIQKKDQQVLLQTQDGQSLLWPCGLLEGVEVGSIVSLVVFISEDIDQERSRFSKIFLNEILQEN